MFAVSSGVRREHPARSGALAKPAPANCSTPPTIEDPYPIWQPNCCSIEAAFAPPLCPILGPPQACRTLWAAASPSSSRASAHYPAPYNPGRSNHSPWRRATRAYPSRGAGRIRDIPGLRGSRLVYTCRSARTPKAIVHQINQDLNKALADPALLKRFKDLGAFARPMSPDRQRNSSSENARLGGRWSSALD